MRETSEGLGEKMRKKSSLLLASAEICGSATLRTDASVLVVPGCSFVCFSKGASLPSLPVPASLTFQLFRWLHHG